MAGVRATTSLAGLHEEQDKRRAEITDWLCHLEQMVRPGPGENADPNAPALDAKRKGKGSQRNPWNVQAALSSIEELKRSKDEATEAAQVAGSALRAERAKVAQLQAQLAKERAESRRRVAEYETAQSALVSKLQYLARRYLAPDGP
jgi:hypothetical protein